jgi:hypothetical protein
MGVLDTATGPLLIGVVLNILLYGVMIMQTFEYYRNCHRDPKWLKYFVAFIFVADTANSVFDVVTIYGYFIKDFGDFVAISRSNWVAETDPAMTAIISASVQYFFAYRVGRLTGKRWLGLIIATTTTVQLLGGLGTAIGCGIVRVYAEFHKVKAAVITWLAGAAFTDLLITTSLVWYLRRTRTGITQTDDLISKIIRLTIQTGLATSVCACIDLVLYLSYDNNLHLIFNFPLCKIYTNSLLSSLNARTRWEETLRPSGPSTLHSSASPRTRNAGGRLVHVGKSELEMARGKSSRPMSPIRFVAMRDVKTDMSGGEPDVSQDIEAATAVDRSRNSQEKQSEALPHVEAV